MNRHFFHPEQRTFPGVVSIIVPGLPKPVYTTRSMAEQLKALIEARNAKAARSLVQVLGGMDFQT